MKVSVCLVTYNQEKYIRECIQSILSQETNFDFEVIVGDDASLDNTAAILRELKDQERGKKIHLFLRERNIGASQNYVDVHSHATGEYVCHCDGDDRWLPGKLQAQVDFLDREKEFSVCWTRVNFFDDKGAYSRGENYDYSMFKDNLVTLEDFLMYGSLAVHSSIMYRRESRKGISVPGTVLDIFFSWEFLKKGKGKILDHVLAEYRVSSVGSVSKDGGYKTLYAKHLQEFYRENLKYRKEVFICSLFNMLVDIKNGRPTWKLFFKTALSSFVIISPFELFSKCKVFTRMRIPILLEHK